MESSIPSDNADDDDDADDDGDDDDGDNDDDDDEDDDDCYDDCDNDCYNKRMLTIRKWMIMITMTMHIMSKWMKMRMKK